MKKTSDIAHQAPSPRTQRPSHPGAHAPRVGHTTSAEGCSQPDGEGAASGTLRRLGRRRPPPRWARGPGSKPRGEGGRGEGERLSAEGTGRRRPKAAKRKGRRRRRREKVTKSNNACGRHLTGKAAGAARRYRGSPQRRRPGQRATQAGRQGRPGGSRVAGRQQAGPAGPAGPAPARAIRRERRRGGGDTAVVVVAATAARGRLAGRPVGRSGQARPGQAWHGSARSSDLAAATPGLRGQGARLGPASTAPPRSAARPVRRPQRRLAPCDAYAAAAALPARCEPAAAAAAAAGAGAGDGGGRAGCCCCAVDAVIGAAAAAAPGVLSAAGRSSLCRRRRGRLAWAPAAVPRVCPVRCGAAAAAAAADAAAAAAAAVAAAAAAAAAVLFLCRLLDGRGRLRLSGCCPPAWPAVDRPLPRPVPTACLPACRPPGRLLGLSWPGLAWPGLLLLLLLLLPLLCSASVSACVCARRLARCALSCPALT